MPTQNIIDLDDVYTKYQNAKKLFEDAQTAMWEARAVYSAARSEYDRAFNAIAAGMFDKAASNG